MKLISYFPELRLIYYELTKIKTFSRINKWLSKKEKQRGDTWQRQSVPRGMMTSAWRHHDVTPGSALLTSAVGPADVSVDQVNIDQVNIDQVNIDQVNIDQVNVDRWLVNRVGGVRKSVGPTGQPHT